MLLILLYFLSFFFVHNLYDDKDARLYGTNKNNVQEIVICFLLLFGFFGFRNLNILNDTNHYYQHYYLNVLTEPHSSIFDINILDRFEPGYLVYENIVATFFKEPYSIICISALIVTLLNLYNISRVTKNVSLVIYCLLGTILLTEYSGIRQGLASCISTTALIFFLQGKKKFYYPLIVLATTIHTSAIILMLFPFIKYIKINKRNIVIALLLAIVVFNTLDSLIGQIGFQDSVYSERSNTRETLPLASFMNFFVASLFLYSSYQLSRRNKIRLNNVWWWISIINVIVLGLDMRLQIMARFSTFFYTLSICLWVNLLQEEKNPFYRRGCMVILCMTLFVKMFVSLTLRPEWYHLYPYSFYEFTGSFKDLDFDY